MIRHTDQKTQINRLHTSKLTKASSTDNRKYMDDYFSRIFCKYATKSNHIRNSEGTGLINNLQQNRHCQLQVRDYFSMNVDVFGNFTLM